MVQYKGGYYDQGLAGEILTRLRVSNIFLVDQVEITSDMNDLLIDDKLQQVSWKFLQHPDVSIRIHFIFKDCTIK